jgi:hypothetical protein
MVTSGVRVHCNHLYSATCVHSNVLEVTTWLGRRRSRVNGAPVSRLELGTTVLHSNVTLISVRSYQLLRMVRWHAPRTATTADVTLRATLATPWRDLRAASRVRRGGSGVGPARKVKSSVLHHQHASSGIVDRLPNLQMVRSPTQQPPTFRRPPLAVKRLAITEAVEPNTAHAMPGANGQAVMRGALCASVMRSQCQAILPVSPVPVIHMARSATTFVLQDTAPLALRSAPVKTMATGLALISNAP